jgi:hypothetical protein
MNRTRCGAALSLAAILATLTSIVWAQEPLAQPRKPTDSGDNSNGAHIVGLRAVLVENDGVAGIEYRSGETLVGRSTEAAPAGLELLLPGAKSMPVQFRTKTQREGVIELGPVTVGALTLRWHIAQKTPSLVERTLEVSAETAQRFSLTFPLDVALDGEFAAFTGPVTEKVVFDTGVRERRNQTFPVAMLRTADRVFGVVADSPGYWENRCLVSLDPARKQMAVMTGDGGDPFRMIIKPPEDARDTYQYEMDGWQTLAAGQTRRFSTWVFASSARNHYDAQVAFHLALANAKGWKTYMDVLHYDDDDCPASNQGFHCGALMAAKELGLPATDQDIVRAIAAYQRIFNAKLGFMPTSLKQQDVLGQDTLYGATLTYAVFGRKVLTDEQVLAHYRTSEKVKSRFGLRVISAADGSLLPGHDGSYCFGGSWFFCDSGNYLLAGVHGLPAQEVDARLIERIQLELAEHPAFNEDINTVSGQPHGNAPYADYSVYVWLRKQIRARLNQSGPDPVGAAIDARLGVLRENCVLRLTPEQPGETAKSRLKD